jgi:hypothetical protein
VFHITAVERRRERLFLAPTAGCRNLAGRHQVTNILLKELVVIIELIVLTSHRLDAAKYGCKRFLKGLGVPLLKRLAP